MLVSIRFNALIVSASILCSIMMLDLPVRAGSPGQNFHSKESPTGKGPSSLTDGNIVAMQPESHPDYLLVGYRGKKTIQMRQSIHAATGTELVRSFQRIPVDVVRVKKGGQRDAAMAAYKARPDIAYVEPNYRLTKSLIPNDPSFGQLWGLHNTGQDGGTAGADIAVTNVWATSGTGSTNIIVAVIDTGIDYNHPELAANMWKNAGEIPGNSIDDDGNGIVDDVYGARWNSGTGLPTSGDPMDGDGHGTHVSGTIGGHGNNGVGVAGVNWRVRLMALKFLDDNGSGYTADAVAAIEYAINKGAHLSNNSWGGGGFSQALKDMIDAAGVSNQLFIAAAGNSNSDNDVLPSYPASYASANIVAVASSDRNDLRSYFSSYGRTSVHIAAPGSEIYSTIPGSSYDTYDGTSMATPHVSGAAALLLSMHPGTPYATLKSWLTQGARRLPVWSGLTTSGGRLQVSESARIAALPSGYGPVSGFTASSTNDQAGAVLSWFNPGGSDFSHVVVRRGTNYFPSTWTDGSMVYTGTLQQAVDEPLVVGTRMYYSIWSVYVNVTGTYYSAPQYTSVRVGGEPDDYFTEIFSSADNDLDFITVSFITNKSLNRYEAFADTASGFPVDPSGGTPLVLSDDDAVQVNVSGGQSVRLYGNSYTSFFVGANGYITFNDEDTVYSENLAAHFDLPRISALFDDLNPSSAGIVSWTQLGDRVAVTFEGVTEYGQNNLNSFQVEMFFNGMIRITWLDIAAMDGLAGLSQGEGTAENFVESNLSDFPLPDSLRITPRNGLIATGYQGGPFDPSGIAYYLTNASDADLSWTLSATSSWISLDASSGTLAAGSGTSVLVSINSAAYSLDFGYHSAPVTFSNAVSGRAQSRVVSVSVTRTGVPALYYADFFLGANPVIPALQAKGYPITKAASWAEFNQLLASNEYFLAIALNQSGFLEADYSAVSNHLAAGRRAWLIDWSRETPFAQLFEGQYSGVNNQNPVTILNNSLAAGVTNPLPLQNPGWTTMSWGIHPAGDGESLAQFPNNHSAVIWGNRGKSALIGFSADSVAGIDGQRFFENLLDLVEAGGDAMFVTPSAPWNVSGYELGPFSPTSRIFTIQNDGSNSLTWTVNASSNWVTMGSITTGSLSPGASATITANLESVSAAALLPGTYTQHLVFSNLVSGGLVKRTVSIHVIPLPGEISVSDSIAPTNDLTMAFEDLIVGQSQTETITIRNIHGVYPLVIESVGILSAAITSSEWEGSKTLLPLNNAPPAVVNAPAISVDEVKESYMPDSLLIGFTPGLEISKRAAIHAAAGGQRVHSYRYVAVDVVSLAGGSNLKEVIQHYQAQPGVAYAEPNYIVRADAVPNDPRYMELWAMNNTGQTGGTPGADIRAPTAWDITTGSTNVIVAVIDTGIDYNHPDLAGNMWMNPDEIPGNGIDDDSNGIIDDVHGARWVDGSGVPTSGDPMDGNQHGTHCAGTIGGIGDNNVGVAGVNWRVRFMALKFLSDFGSGSTADAISAIEYAIDKGARLSNNSWGGGGFSQALQDAIDAAGAANQLFIAAAGNSGTDNDSSPHYPSSYSSENIIAVASSDHFDERSSFSCFGRNSVDLAAPGSSILSTTPGGNYGILSGTSMATPHVTGAAALLWAINPSASYNLVKEALMSSVDVRPAWSDVTVSGGRLNASAAMLALNPNFQLEGLDAFPISIAPGASLTFNVIYRPVESGDHTGIVRIVSNDDLTPEVQVALSGSAVNDVLEVWPNESLASEGAPGGPFLPSEKIYSLTNSGEATINWALSFTGAWLTASSSSGSLVPGGTSNITISIAAQASMLPNGVYQSMLVFSNQVSGVVKTRSASLRIEPQLCDALDDCSLTWSSGGAAQWISQTETTHDDVDAGQSGAINDSQESWMETTVTGPGILTFWWKVSSEDFFDYLEVYVDDVFNSAISGEVNWQQKSLVIGNGAQTIRWLYSKDSSVDDGQDLGWVDEVSFTPDVITAAGDHAGNYGPGSNFVHGANGGTGFQPWEITAGSGATAVLDNSTNGTANINSANNNAFRFYGGTSGSYVDAIRPFGTPLRSGEVFRATIAYNWNGGARGMNVLDENYAELFNINFGGGDTLSFAWGLSASITLSTTWSPTAVLQVAVTQLHNNQLQVQLTRNDGFTTNLISTALWSPAAMVKFYNGGHPGNSLNYALYANNLIIERLIPPVPPCGLIISEYVEGSSFNKAIELFNGTDSTINLADGYQIVIYFNGSTNAGNTINLNGTIAGQSTFILAHSSAAAAITNLADQLSSSLSFNGNDAVILRRSAVIYDSIGQVGNINNYAIDQTLVRKPAVTSGDTNAFNVFTPATEWSVFSSDTFTNLNWHVMTCEPDAGTDTDGDGLPDWWEFAHFGGPTNANHSTMAANGVNTIGEAYIADLDPQNPNAFFPPVELSNPSSGTMTLVVDPTSTARVYRVQWSTNLMANPQMWSLYLPEKTGTSFGLTFTVTNEVSGRIYRTGVRLP